MKLFYIGMGMLLLLLGFTMGLGFAPVSAAPTAVPEGKAPPLPESLAALYPPQAEQPLYYLHMHALDQALTGFVNDLMQGDMQNAVAGFAAFKQAYLKIGELVPEWRHYLDNRSLDAAEKALGAGDQPALMGAMEKLGQSCEACHHPNMARVSLIYRWPRGKNSDVSDPVTGGVMPYGQFKQMLSTSFGGIGADLMQGQLENARKDYDAFAARFRSLQMTCTDCHTTDRYYFVDDEMEAKVDELGARLKSEKPDAAAIQGLMMDIGTDTCAKCHQVHVSGAYAEYYAK